jgi:hypothetical protein
MHKELETQLEERYEAVNRRILSGENTQICGFSQKHPGL